MISHISLGTNDLQRAERFYDAILIVIQATKTYSSERVIFWGFPNSTVKLSITVPFDGEPAFHGNGTMVALKVEDAGLVDAIFTRAIELGAISEGEPGERNQGAYYGAYFRDLDGNKVAIFSR
ncbi:hypothetical protein Misp06_00166 [Microbulbifer sp. NBRC 101763]|uniref:VOC family protein n=1 Tax=Microbulbifer TaxID=48073 RepID=UPI00036F3F45|nr:VOC family protein [Microbulbifer variabilis]